ncbi:MAG: hypothetical protein AAF806_29865 [Bacteroidota bacterium]
MKQVHQIFTLLLFLSLPLLSSAQSKATTPLEGAWYLMEGTYNGKTKKAEKPFQFKIFTNKHYAYLMQSEAGAWNQGMAGSYKMKDNTYIESCEFSSIPAQVGTSAEWKYSFKGDQLIIEGPIRIMNADGSDNIAFAGFLNTIREVRVRAE